MRPLVLFAAIAAASAGCEAPPKGEKAPELRQRELGEGAAPVIAVRKIADESGKILGFLKVMEELGTTKEVKGKPVQTHWVYDFYFKPLGFYTVRGHTYKLITDRFTGKQTFQDFDEHDVDDSKRILLGMKARTPIQLLPMDDPRTLDSDAEAARAKAAAQAPKPASAEGGEKPAAEAPKE